MAKKRAYELIKLVLMRLNISAGDATGFAHVQAFEPLDHDIVYVWVVTKDAKSAVLEDEASIFPSDSLITKLRLLQQEM